MNKFKIGDKIKMTANCNGCIEGKIYTIVGNPYNNPMSKMGVENESKGDSCTCEYKWELINNNIIIKNMSLKQKFAMLMKGEPEKSFFKAGITNADYSLTTEGQGILMEWLLKKNGAEFKAEVVDPILKEQEKDSTCS